MNILGINAAFHDSAACLLRDGRLVAAAEEERFVRLKKHKASRPFQAAALPFHAIAYCLAEAGLTLADIDHVAYSFDPQPLVDGSILQPKAGQDHRDYGYDPWRTVFLAGTLAAPRLLLDDVPWALKTHFFHPERPHSWQFHFVPHHLAHAASAFFPSPFAEAAVLTLDGQGGDATTACYSGRGRDLTLLSSVNLPHSLGLLYECLTAYLGFQPSADEFKVMALAALGQPRYLPQVLAGIRVTDGSYELRMPDFRALCGPPRARHEALRQCHYDLACSVQQALETTVLALADWLHQRTGHPALCLAGGVAMNCVLNGVLRAKGPFAEVWVPPAAGDAGTALGAAWQVASQLDPAYDPTWTLPHAFWGPGFADEAIEALLRTAGVAYIRPPDLPAAVAQELAAGRVLGWFQGRMELGARALGNRSLLASPLDAAMQQRLNQLKGRESFRPVAALVPEEQVSEWFEFEGPAPFMNFVAAARPERAHRLVAATHVDGSSRLQTVSAATTPLLHRVLREFEQVTGVPVLINTSFNTQGEPIVCTPREALATYFTSGLDGLAIGPFLLTKLVAQP